MRLVPSIFLALIYVLVSVYFGATTFGTTTPGNGGLPPLAFFFFWSSAHALIIWLLTSIASQSDSKLRDARALLSLVGQPSIYTVLKDKAANAVKLFEMQQQRMAAIKSVDSPNPKDPDLAVLADKITEAKKAFWSLHRAAHEANVPLFPSIRDHAEWDEAQWRGHGFPEKTEHDDAWRP